MKIFELMNELITEIEESKKSIFSGKKTIEVDYVLDILNEINDVLPKEIHYAREIINQKQAIINDARNKAHKILEGANYRLHELVEDSRVTQLAYEKSNRLIDEAKSQAYEIKLNADDYAVNVLEDLISYMNEYKNIIRQNKDNIMVKKDRNQRSLSDF